MAGAALAACTTLAWRDPSEEGAYGMCPWLLATGTHCPGCGSLRCINRLLAGDVIGAIGYNALTVLSVPFLLIAYLRWALPVRFAHRLPDVTDVSTRGLLALAGLVLGFWLLRNTPVAPFSAFAP